MTKKLIMAACLSVLVLGTSVLASSASAQWMVNGTSLAGNEELLAQKEVHDAITFQAAGVTLTCAGSIEGTSAQIEAGDKGSAQSLTFKGCSANESCTIPTSITTVPLSTTVVLGAGAAANITYQPKTKSHFATIKFTGAECALLGIQPLDGTAKVLAPTGQEEHVVQSLEANTAKTSGELKIGASAAELKGSWLETIIKVTLIEHPSWGFL